MRLGVIDAAAPPLVDELFGEFADGGVAMGEADLENSGVRCSRVVDLTALGRRRRHRFLEEHVLARAESCNRVFGVPLIRHPDDDGGRGGIRPQGLRRVAHFGAASRRQFLRPRTVDVDDPANAGAAFAGRRRVFAANGAGSQDADVRG